MPSSIFLLSALAFFSGRLVQAGITVHPSCPSDVKIHLNDAIQMGKVASEEVAKKELRDAGDNSTTSGLYQVLFDDADRSKVQSTYDKISKLDTTSFEIKIYCNEDTIYWPPGADKKNDNKTMFYAGDFHDENGKEVTTWLGNTPNVTLPRQSMCNEAPEAYTINGYKLWNADLSNQVHIILCPEMFNATTVRDGRRIPDIKKDGILRKYTSLDVIRPLSMVLIHELAHSNAVSGPRVVDGQINQGVILDGNGAYGFAKCRELRKKDSHAPVKNADSFAYLAMGLSLQFQDKCKDFSWVAGAINIGNGKGDYTPYVPSGITARVSEIEKFIFDAFTKKRTNLYENGGLAAGWKQFFA